MKKLLLPAAVGYAVFSLCSPALGKCHHDAGRTEFSERQQAQPSFRMSSEGRAQLPVYSGPAWEEPERESYRDEYMRKRNQSK